MNLREGRMSFFKHFSGVEHAQQSFENAMNQYKQENNHENKNELEEGLFLREGIDYFVDEKQQKGVFEEVANWFKGVINASHDKIMKDGPQEKKTLSDNFKGAVEYFLSPSVQKDLEIMNLLRYSELTFKQKDEFLQLFSNGATDNAQNDVSNTVLLDILHPHELTMRLFGNQLKMFLNSEMVEFTEKFTDGSDTYFIRDTDLTGKLKTKDEKITNHSTELVAPRFVTSDFSTGQDHVFHLKLMRLLEDYYQMDVSSEEGLAMIDQLFHTYDISPGEDTLERSQPIPMPEHTFDELPIMKYDGFEDCDVDPEPDRTVEKFDVSAIEDTLQKFLKEVSTKTGQTIELSSYKQNNKLTPEQFALLRGILLLENSDERRVRLLEKIWGTLLPETELKRLFHDQYIKFNENHH